MGKKIITIGRETGSGGHEIAERLAKRLNIPLYDRNLVEKAREELKLDKEETSWDEQILSNFAMAYQGAFGVNRPYYMAEYSTSLSDTIYKTEAKIIRELAEKGPCIIVGRCADYVLRNREDVCSVFISAEKEDRIARMMKVREVNRERAEHIIRETDKNRSTYYNTYTNKKWDSPETYHIILNASYFDMDTIVDMLAKIYEQE